MKKMKMIMNKKYLAVMMAIAIVAIACCKNANKGDDSACADGEATQVEEIYEETVEVVDTCGLRMYYPKYSRIDLVCGEMPKKEDKEVIMFVEAAFTGELLDTFKHTNIAGDHVSGGIRHKGYTCKRNNGAFVWYGGKAEFHHENYSHALDKAAKNGGCGVSQEMMIHATNWLTFYQ